MFGATKEGEYQRTIDMLVDKTGKSRKEVMFILYFLADSQYSNADLMAMAKLIQRGIEFKQKNAMERGSNMKYFEIMFNENDSMCGRGLTIPTPQEAEEFYKEDTAMYGGVVVDVVEMNKEDAESLFDFDNEVNWPVYCNHAVYGQS